MKKLMRIVSIFMLVIVAVLGLSACSEDENKILEKTYSDLFSNVDKTQITDDLSFPTKVGDVTISYISTNAKVIANNGNVNRPDEDTAVYVIIKLTYKNTTLEKNEVFNVIAAEKVPSIQVTCEKTSIAKGESIDLKVSIVNTEEKSYSWNYSVEGLLQVEVNTLKCVGNVKEDTVVTVTAVLDSDNTVKSSFEITVVAPTVEFTSATNEITLGDAISLNVNATNIENKKVIWSVSDPSILTVSASNVLTVLNDVENDTQVTVTATLQDNQEISFSKTFTVKHKLVPTIQVLTTHVGKISKGDRIKLEVAVTDAKIGTYSWSYSVQGLVEVTDTDELIVLKTVKVDTTVNVKVTLDEDKSIYDSVTFVVKAQLVAGNNGDLTSQMIEEIGNENITVTGVVTDYYHDYQQSFNNSTNSYDMTVKMEEGKWFGSWCHSSNKNTVLTNIYKRGTEQVTDVNGVTGHALKSVYIDKNNAAKDETVKDYNSVPSLWETNHLWNHLGNLDINKFAYDSDTNRYYYIIDDTKEEDLYLMTYLAYSLTPMLEDTFFELYFIVEDGHITKMVAQTEILLYGADVQEDATGDSYTVAELSFSAMGSTTVEDPAPYEAPEYADKLEAALTSIKNAKNYTFHAVETQTYAPSGDSGDYEIQSASTTSGPVKKLASRVADNTSANGTVGIYGQVTENAVLFAKTGKYDYSMDDKIYFTKYSGYYDYDTTDGSFDGFEYNTSLKTLAGVKRYIGEMFDVMPQFNISPNIFKLQGAVSINGKTTYTFVLRETAIMRAVALELSAHSYATDASASTSVNFTIKVSDEGELMSVTYPYSLVNGTYMGYITTTFSNIGTTEIAAGTFDSYVPRELKTSWSQYITKYYSPDFSSKTTRDEDTSVVLEAVYGDLAKLMPSPEVFLNVVGDNIFGPFYNWKTVATDQDGNDIYHGYITLTVRTDYADENAKISSEQWDALSDQLTKALNASGLTKDSGNSGNSGSNRYLTFTAKDPVTQEGIEVVIENNGTRYLWIYFYILGDWKLSSNN